MANSTTNIDVADELQEDILDVLNGNHDAGSMAMFGGRHASVCVALTFGIYGGISPLSGNFIANQTFALTTAVTNYIRLNRDDTFTVTTSAPTGWPTALADSAWPVYDCLCGASTVTSYNDRRRFGAPPILGIPYAYSSTTSAADPGSGTLRFNNTTLASATALYISETDGLGRAIAALIALWDDGTGTNKSQLQVSKTSDPTKFANFHVTGTNTDNGAWDTVNLSYVTGNGSLTNGDAVTMTPLSTGATGATGPASDGHNLLINGGPDVWQAGTSFAPVAGTRMRTADTWWGLRPTSANWTVSRQAGVNNRYAIRAQRTAASTETHDIKLAVSLETQDAAWMATALPAAMVVSFYARKGADYSAASGNLVVKAIRGTGTDQNELDGYTGSSTLATLTQALTTSFVRYQFTFVPDASTNELAVEFTFTPVGTAGAADYFDIECLQVEVGAAATAFERLPMVRSRHECGRYYQKSFAYATTPAQATDTTGVYFWLPNVTGAVSVRSPMYALVPRMRTTPTVVTFNPVSANSEVRDIGGTADCTLTAAGTVGISESGINVTCTTHAGVTTSSRLSFHWTAADANF